NLRKVSQWLKKLANEANLNVINVFLISSETGLGMKEVAKEMELQRKGHNNYVVGVTNVGKSTFINKYIDNATGLKEVITTSYFPGNTIDFINLLLADNISFIDQQGLV